MINETNIKKTFNRVLFFVFIAVVYGVIFLLSLIPHIETILILTIAIIYVAGFSYLIRCIIIWIITGKWRFFTR